MFLTKLKIAMLLLGIIIGTGLIATARVVGTQPSWTAPREVPEGVAQPAAKQQPKPADLEAVLKAKDFWAKIGKKTDHPDLATKVPAIKNLAGEAKDVVVRIRAFKLLADLDNRTKHNSAFLPVQVEDAIEGAFTHIEAHLKNPAIQKFRPQIGFTHITVSKKGGDADGVWVLIETTNPGESGGINVRWNPMTKKVDNVEHWGSDRAQ